MGVLDKFLNAMRLGDDDGFDDEDYLDEEYDDYEVKPKKRLFKKSDRDYDDLDDFGEDTGAAEKTSAAAASPSLAKAKTSSSKISPIRPKRSGSGMEVCVIKPHTMEDSREITETLLNNCTVILNMEGLDLEIAQRIIDFASGSCFAIHGKLQKISSFIFVLTPANVDISGDFQEILSGAIGVPNRSVY